MPAYVPLTLQLKPDWVESFYRLLTDLSEGRIREYKRQSPFAPRIEQVPKAEKPKPKTFPNCIASYCNCGKCYDRVLREHKFPWKLVDENKIFMAREGKSVTLCSALSAGLKDNYKVGDLLGHVVKSSYELSNVNKKDESLRQEEILDLKKRVDLRAERKVKGELEATSLTNQDLEHQIKCDKQSHLKKEISEDKCQFCDKGIIKQAFVRDADQYDQEGEVRDIDDVLKERNNNGRDIEIVERNENYDKGRTDVKFKYVDHNERCKLVQGLKDTQNELYNSWRQQSSGAGKRKSRRDQPDMATKPRNYNNKKVTFEDVKPQAPNISVEPEWSSQKDWMC